MKEPLSVAIVGCGVIGHTHCESFQRISGVSVRWVCDVQAERAEKLALKYGVERHGRTEEALADPAVQIVSICTDHDTHAGLLEQALAAGKDVLCEKPLGISPEDLGRMSQAERRHPGQIAGGVLQHRFDPVYRSVRDWIARRELGWILTANLQLQCYRSESYYRMDAWRGTWAREGGSLMINQAIHFVDALQWMMGGVAEVFACHANLTHREVIETEDTVTATLRFRDGSLGSLLATSGSLLDWEPRIHIHGTEGLVEILNGQLIRLQCRSHETEARLREELAKRAEPQKTEVGKAYYGPSHPSLIADFVEACRLRRRPFVTLDDAAEAVRVVLAIYQSHAKKTSVELPGMREDGRGQSTEGGRE